MTPSALPRTRLEIHFLWLVRLRWIAVAGQWITILFTEYWLKLNLPVTLLIAIGLFSALSNLLIVTLSKIIPLDSLTKWTLFLDVLLLTTLLYFSGGPMNPFSALYLVHIVLALIILSELWAWIISCTSLICFGSLFFHYHSIPKLHHHHDMGVHLLGMWVALGVTSIIIVYFVRHILKSVTILEADLESNREQTRRRDKILSLGTFATGAAHELSTPLSTIALIAKELEIKLKNESSRIKADIQAIQKETSRCKTILFNLSAYSGQQQGEALTKITLEKLTQDIIAPYQSDLLADLPTNLLVHIPSDQKHLELTTPLEAVRMCLRNIVQNALDVSDKVVINAKIDNGRVIFEVSDQGPGISDAIIEHLGEPFVTTKKSEKGMGLGLYVTYAILDQIDGKLTYKTNSQGSVFTIDIPVNFIQS
ncbi:MAG: HAMP domain-containing histidine kinase [Bdellovibrionales bacterium]|nr:HAMP domain-containing histidine kinase [Bdellovibrionales bacterium]